MPLDIADPNVSLISSTSYLTGILSNNQTSDSSGALEEFQVVHLKASGDSEHLLSRTCWASLGL